MTYGTLRIKRCPPTPFDINQLHLIVALSRQRPRVRVPSSPPFFQALANLTSSKLGHDKHRMRMLPSKNVSETFPLTYNQNPFQKCES